MRFSIGASLSSLPFSPRLVRLCAAVGLISLGFYICIQAIAYIEQVGAGKGAAAFELWPPGRGLMGTCEAWGTMHHNKTTVMQYAVAA